MKKSIFLSAIAAMMAVVACNKNVDTVNNTIDNAIDEPTGNIRIRVGMALQEETKAPLAEVKDAAINSLQVFVFNGNNLGTGLLETDVFKDGINATASTSMTINVKTGEKTVYALVNHPRVYLTAGVTTMQAFENTLTDLKYNKPNSLVMSGKNVINVVDYNNMGTPGTPQELGIYVKRLAAMISLENVTVDFRENSLKGATFQVKEIYLKNILGRAPQGVDGLTATAGSTAAPLKIASADVQTPGNWYNPIVRTANTDIDAIVYDNCGIDCTVEGAVTPMKRNLFAYPNPVAGDQTIATWDNAGRHTRLIIHAVVNKNADGVTMTNKDTYYVLTLPALVANTVYSIQGVKITQLGKDDDNNDELTDVGKVNVTVNVDNWLPTVVLNYEY